jgi:DNA-binding IclR family transcriptional regulator
VVYVDKVDSPQPLKAMTTIGSRVPATVTSSGKALLAWLPSSALDQAMAELERYTPLTLMKRQEVEADLEETRVRGYAVNRGEFREGVAGIAAVIRDRHGAVVAAVTLWGSDRNILGPGRDNLARMAMVAARDISRDLGHIEPAAAKARAPHATAEVA